MRKYYVLRSEFSNVYNLIYTEGGPAPEGYERITRKDAEKLCSAENRRRKENPAFAYSADAMIFPADFDKYTEDPYDPNSFERVGYVLERVFYPWDFVPVD